MNMSGTIKILNEEVNLSDNKSQDIALASFSGYLGFVGEVSSQYGVQQEYLIERDCINRYLASRILKNERMVA
jgi:hypothetical protein